MACVGRLRLRNAVSSIQLRFTDAATYANDWSFPAKTFDVKDLTGQYVGVIGYDNVEKKEKIMISAVLTRDNEIAPGSYPLSIVDQDGWVLVLTGNEVLRFRGLTHTVKKEADLSLIATPQTPSPRSEKDEEQLADLPGLWDTTGNCKVCPKTIQPARHAS